MKSNGFIYTLCLLRYIVFLSAEEDVCDSPLNAFSDSVSNFSSCAIANSRPITLCENCVENYINVLDAYRNMSNIVDGDTKCIDHFINLDRLGIVDTMFKNSFNLWNNAKCDECFVLVNSTLTPDLSKETIQFNEYYMDLLRCVNNTNRTVPSNLCSICLESYITLNNYYASISDENDKIGICMDIVDLMNTTRRFWNKNCCEYRKHKEPAFLGTAIAITFLTVIFYTLTNFFGQEKTPAILIQSRLAESLSRVNEESTSSESPETSQSHISSEEH